MIENETSDETELIARACAGSTHAFGRLVRLHQQPLRSFLRRLTNNAADADDIAQDAFVRAWSNLKRFDQSRSFRAWLYGIAYRRHLYNTRSLFRFLKYKKVFASIVSTSSEMDATPDLRRDISVALAELSVGEREAIVLCLGAGFTNAEAADLLKMPLGTVKSHLVRAREKLALRLGPLNE